MRAVAGRSTKVRFRFEDESGSLVDPTPDPTVVAVTRGDGAALLGAPTGALTKDGANTGVWYATLPAQSQLDVLTVKVTGTLAGGEVVNLSEQVQLVDRRAVPLSVMRQDTVLSPLPVLDFLDIVDAAEDAITGELRFPMVLEGTRAEFRTRSCVRLSVPGVYWPVSLYALTLNGNDVFDANVVVRDNALERGYGDGYMTAYVDPILGMNGFPWLPGVYNAWLAHGWTETPADLQRAVVALARHYAQSGTQQAYPDRATRIMTEASEIWLARPGTDAPFGIPEVDAAVVRHRLPEPLSDDPGAF